MLLFTENVVEENLFYIVSPKDLVLAKVCFYSCLGKFTVHYFVFCVVSACSTLYVIVKREVYDRKEHTIFQEHCYVAVMLYFQHTWTRTFAF